MKKLSVDSLRTLFSFLEQQIDSVLWIRSKDYERQLYLSPNFENVWGYPADLFYQTPTAFKETILAEDRDVVREMIQPNEKGEPRTSYLYRIGLPTGEIKHIKDWHYLLTDEHDYILGHAGFAKVMSETLWHAEQKTALTINSAATEEVLQRYIFGILKNELHINAQNIAISSPKCVGPIILDDKNKPIDLTSRELECINLLISGKSAKQTGSMLNISQRTVEFHLDNVKSKARCRTKLELLSRINSRMNA